MSPGSAAAVIMASLLITACSAVSYPPPTITVDRPDLRQITYQPWAEAPIPGDDLTAIGHATGDLGDLVTDATAYAIRGVEPAAFVALAIDPARYEDRVAGLVESEPDYRPPPVEPTHQIWVTDLDVASAPAVLCAYFDPRSERTPPICQAPVSVVLDRLTH